MAEVEPQYASDYDDRTTVSVRSVLVEIGQVLGSYQGKFAVIGGAVPWLLLSEADMPHIGTLDMDLTLDAEALGDGEYAQLVESLLRHGYRQQEHLRRFQLVRTVPARDGGADIDVVVDFLMPRDATIARNAPPLVANFAVQRADGADLALKFHQGEQIDGSFVLGEQTYLLEARWRNAKVDAETLRAFNAKVEDKASWSRGLIVSQSGFTEDGLHAFGRGKSVVCMDGLDLHDVLVGRLDLAEVIALKVRRAAETGVAFVRVRDLNVPARG